jgi:uncharacterized membrane protein YfcA
VSGAARDGTGPFAEGSTAPVPADSVLARAAAVDGAPGAAAADAGGQAPTDEVPTDEVPVALAPATLASAAPRGPWLAAAGALIAVVGALCGIGGGLFAVPLLHYGFRVPLRRAVATSLALVMTTGAAATFAELLHGDNALLWNLVLPLVAGALLGATYGFELARKLPEVWLKALFLVALSSVGVRMGLTPSGIEAPLPGAELFAWRDTLIVFALGLGAGAVAPMLGIGGGLVVVPGMLLLVPDAGSLGARAASLAMTVPNAARSLQLYLREGAVEGRIAAWFCVGAVLGGVVGVQLVHLPGAPRVGQVLLGVILVGTAARFGFDLAKFAGSALEKRRP